MHDPKDVDPALRRGPGRRLLGRFGVGARLPIGAEVVGPSVEVVRNIEGEVSEEVPDQEDFEGVIPEEVFGLAEELGEEWRGHFDYIAEVSERYREPTIAALLDSLPGGKEDSFWQSRSSQRALQAEYKDTVKHAVSIGQRMALYDEPKVTFKLAPKEGGDLSFFETRRAKDDLASIIVPTRDRFTRIKQIEGRLLNLLEDVVNDGIGAGIRLVEQLSEFSETEILSERELVTLVANDYAANKENSFATRIVNRMKHEAGRGGLSVEFLQSFILDDEGVKSVPYIIRAAGIDTARLTTAVAADFDNWPAELANEYRVYVDQILATLQKQMNDLVGKQQRKRKQYPIFVNGATSNKMPVDQSRTASSRPRRKSRQRVVISSGNGHSDDFSLEGEADRPEFGLCTFDGRVLDIDDQEQVLNLLQGQPPSGEAYLGSLKAMLQNLQENPRGLGCKMVIKKDRVIVVGGSKIRPYTFNPNKRPGFSVKPSDQQTRIVYYFVAPDRIVVDKIFANHRDYSRYLGSLN